MVTQRRKHIHREELPFDGTEIRIIPHEGMLVGIRDFGSTKFSLVIGSETVLHTGCIRRLKAIAGGYPFPAEAAAVIRGDGLFAGQEEAVGEERLQVIECKVEMLAGFQVGDGFGEVALVHSVDRLDTVSTYFKPEHLDTEQWLDGDLQPVVATQFELCTRADFLARSRSELNLYFSRKSLVAKRLLIEGTEKFRFGLQCDIRFACALFYRPTSCRQNTQDDAHIQPQRIK